MRHGLSLILWTSQFDNDYMELIPKAKELGYDGVEIPVGDMDLIDVKRVAETLREQEMGCTILPQFGEAENLINPNTNRYAVEQFTRLIQLAGKLHATAIGGAWYTSVGVGKSKRPRTAEEWDLAVASLKKLSKVAENENVLLTLEPITRFETHFLNTSRETVALIEEAGSQSLGVNLDIYHMFMEENDLVETILKTGTYVKHMHVTENHRGIPGTGMTDWKRVTDTLLDVGYDGWMVFETLSPKVEHMIAGGCLWRDPFEGMSREEGARRSVEYLKQFT